MAERLLLRQMLRRWQPNASAPSCKTILIKEIREQQCCYTVAAAANDGENYEKEKNNQWLILPPFTPTSDGSSIGKRLYGLPEETNTTALKWITKCCPHLPRSLVQKLFRLRQVRKECATAENKEQRPRRVGAKDLMDIGDRIYLPKSVDGKFHTTISDTQSFSDEKEQKFVQSLEVYKDSAIIVINKPPGIPVQGGIGIKRSLDEMAAKYLKYDYREPPRLT